MRPTDDRIIVRRVAPSEQTAGGIYIPETARKTTQEGEVVAVGNGRVTPMGRRIPPSVAVGDRVLFGRYSGSEVSINAETVLVMLESDVMVIL